MAFALLSFFIFGAVLSRPIASLSCWSSNDPATLVPLGLIYRRPGEHLRLVCIANFSHATFFPERYGPEDLLFTRVLRGEETGPLPSEILDESSIVTVVSNLTWDDAARYVCKLRVGDGTEKNLCSSQMFIGLDPLPLENFRCISNGLESLDCSWMLPADVIANTSYKVGYRIYNDSPAIYHGYHGCEKTTRKVENEANRYNCTFKNANYIAFNEKLYFFIEADSPLNGSNTPLPILEFHNFRNVRPFPPEKLVVHSVGQRNATISWDIKDKLTNLKDANGLIHEITWMSSHEESPVHERINTTADNLDGRSVRHSLTSLDHPYTNYTVRVRSICGQAEADDLWSGYSEEIQFQTLPDIPGEVPVIPPGAYYFDGGDGALTVYWERVSMSSWNGPNFSYVIDYTDGVVRRRMEADGETFAVRLNGTARERALNFSISAKNDAGMLQGPIVTVPVWHAGRMDVTVEMVKSGVYNISWTPQDSVESVEYYTIFFCEKKPPDEHNQKCKTQPEKVQVNGTVTSKQLQLAEDKFYLFAVNGLSAAGASPLAWYTIHGENSDGDDGDTLTLGLAIGGSLFSILVLVASYPTVLWAIKKYKDMAFVRVHIPNILTKEDLVDGAGEWSEKRPEGSVQGDHPIKENQLGEFTPTPVSGMTGYGPLELGNGFGPGKLFKVESHPSDMIDPCAKEMEARDENELVPRLSDVGDGDVRRRCEFPSKSPVVDTPATLDASALLESKYQKDKPSLGYVVLGESSKAMTGGERDSDVKTVSAEKRASADSESDESPQSSPSSRRSLPGHYVVVGDSNTRCPEVQKPQLDGYVAISAADVNVRLPQSFSGNTEPSVVASPTVNGVTFSVDVDLTHETEMTSAASTPSTGTRDSTSSTSSLDSDSGYVKAGVLDREPSHRPVEDSDVPTLLVTSGLLPSNNLMPGYVSCF